jgi:hypothetical protein
MLVDATDRFLERMANTMNLTVPNDKPSEQAARWEGHNTVDIKKAQAYAARARRESFKVSGT